MLQKLLLIVTFILSNSAFAQVTSICGPNTNQWLGGYYGDQNVPAGSTAPDLQLNNQGAYTASYYSPSSISSGTKATASAISMNSISFIRAANLSATSVTLDDAVTNNDFIASNLTLPATSPIIYLQRMNFNRAPGQTYSVRIGVRRVSESTVTFLGSITVSGTGAETQTVSFAAPYRLQPQVPYEIRYYVSRPNLSTAMSSSPYTYPANTVTLDNIVHFGYIIPSLDSANYNTAAAAVLYTIPYGQSTISTTQLNSLSPSATPPGFTKEWFLEGSATPVSGNVGAGTYYAQYKTGSCYHPASEKVIVRKELYVNTPPLAQVYAGSLVQRSLNLTVNPSGGDGNYNYQIASSCTGGIGTQLSNVTISGQTATYTAPRAPGDYYYCIQVCDTATPAQCKTLTVNIKVRAEPIFNCDQAIYVSRIESTKTNLYRVNSTTNPLSLTSLGSGGYDGVVANIAYNSADNYIYGIDTAGNLVRFNSSGDAINLSTTLAVLPAGTYNAAAFGADNYLYVFSGSGSTMYKINVETKAVTTVTLSSAVQTGDLAYSIAENVFYGYDHNVKKLFTLSTSGTVTYKNFVNTLGIVDAMYVGSQGKVFGIEASTGNFYNFMRKFDGEAFKIANFNAGFRV